VLTNQLHSQNHVDMAKVNLLPQLSNDTLQLGNTVFIVKSLLLLSVLQLSLHPQLLNLCIQRSL